MEQFKRAQVIMLPIKNNNKGLYLNPVPSINILHYANRRILNSYISQHLYITSDDEIKEGDWCIYLGLSMRCFKVINAEDNKLYHGSREYFNKSICKKIIATTNTSLIIEGKLYKTTSNLPQPSQQFIEKYIEEYNKGNIITDVLVEYEMRHTGWTEDQSEYTYDEFLKVNPKDNTITIKKLKDNWNREEVIELIKKAYYDAEIANCGDTVEEWIEENL